VAKLTAVERNKLPSSAFGDPKNRKFPEEDRGHAIAAKSRAKQQENRGALSKGAYEAIVSKANRKIGGR
jgi:hypothetical protein